MHTATDHQGAIEINWLHIWGPLLSSIFRYSRCFWQVSVWWHKRDQYTIRHIVLMLWLMDAYSNPFFTKASHPFHVQRFWQEPIALWHAFLAFMSGSVLCISGSNIIGEHFAYGARMKIRPTLHWPQILLRTSPGCGERGEWVIMDLEQNEHNICAVVCSQGPLQPQTRCQRCGDVLEWSEERRCVSARERQYLKIELLPWWW